MLKKIIAFIKSLFGIHETLKAPVINFTIGKEEEEIINDFPIFPNISHSAFDETFPPKKKKRAYKKKVKTVNDAGLK
jgi:hypothetical protein